MHSRLDSAPRSFGRRRPIGEAKASDRKRADSSPSLFAWTLRVATIVGLLAVAGTTGLARWIGSGDAPTRLAGAAGMAAIDPEMTGAITSAGAARGTHLDPCLLPASARLKP